MPIFPRAKNFVIQGGEFMDIGVQNNIVHGPSGIDILREASTPEAAYDALARHPVPQCFPGTREQYIQDITRWAVPSLGAQPSFIYWMKGPAGVGKSAVAQTCVGKLKGSGHVAAAFFFSINGRDDHTRFFTSLAYQLSTEFPDYHEILDKKVHRDKTLVTKTMASQFKSLIVEPLQELRNRGKGVGSRAIFVDGLDECKSKDAQSEIIEIVAASVREQTTPFRWVFFSRPEPHIEAAFANTTIAPLCHVALLPVSREADKEIKLYLRGEFKNILRRRNLSMSSPWPRDEDIQLLVSASAGLFVYPASVLRFIDQFPSLTPDEPLRAVLAAIQQSNGGPRVGDTKSPFAELDAFYLLIMQRIPKEILPFVQLLFADLLLDGVGDHQWSAIYQGNKLGLSEIQFKGVCNQVHAVLHFQDGPRRLHFDESTVSTRPFVDATPKTEARLRKGVYGVGGLVSFYHKSFPDFLSDPARSGAFCARTPENHWKLFNHYLQLHFYYARSCRVQEPDLTLTPGVANSAASLSWPYPNHSNELVNSYFRAEVFYQITVSLFKRKFNMGAWHQQALQMLSNIDYRKHLINTANLCSGSSTTSRTFGCSCNIRNIRGTVFRHIHPEEFHKFDTAAFKQIISEREKLGIIRPYYPTTPTPTHSPRGDTCTGLYVYGNGASATIWYWELNLKLKYYRDFETCDLRDAQRICRDEKVNPWAVPG